MTPPDEARPPKSIQLSNEIHDYLVDHSTPLDDVQRRLVDDTRALGGISRMQIAPEQGALLTMLVRLSGGRRAVEVGTFTGYSALCIARGLAAGGRLLCCDVSEEWTRIGQAAWEAAGVADRIDLRIAPALETLAALPPTSDVDFAFIDANKTDYVAYWEQLVPRVRPNGLIAVDNVLWGGRVVDPTVDDPDTNAIRAFNDHARADPRTETVMLPVADGLTLARKLA